jgi:hypothetical protein
VSSVALGRTSWRHPELAAAAAATGAWALLTAIVAAEKIVVRSARLRGPAAALLAGAALLALA